MADVVYHRSKLAAYAILRNEDDKVLFMRRANTGYMDGKLGLPAGHVEKNESFLHGMTRELKEEANVMAHEDRAMQSIILHRYQPSGEHDYVDVFFEVPAWDGEVTIAEPNKCSEIVWAKPEDVKAEMMDYVALAFDEMQKGTRFYELIRSDDE